MFIIISLFKTIKKICPQQSKGFSINQSNVRLVYYMTYVFEQYVDHVRINSRTIFYLQLKKFIKLCILTSHHAVPPGPPPSLVSYILCILLSHLAVLPSPTAHDIPFVRLGVTATRDRLPCHLAGSSVQFTETSHQHTHIQSLCLRLPVASLQDHDRCWTYKGLLFKYICILYGM